MGCGPPQERYALTQSPSIGPPPRKRGDLGNDAFGLANWRQILIPPANIARSHRAAQDGRARQIASTHTPRRASAIEPGARQREGNAGFGYKLSFREMRLGLWRRAYRVPDARALHKMPEPAGGPPTTKTAEGGTRKPSAASHESRECRAVGAAAPDSRQPGCGRISPTTLGGPSREGESVVDGGSVRGTYR